MTDKTYKRFYLISLSVLLLLSVYPLVNGVRIAWLNIVNGAVKPEQYAKYIVPYTAICVAVILFSAFQPLLFKMKRLALPAGLLASYAVFFTVEYFVERIRIHTTGMTLVNVSSLSVEELKDVPLSDTIDIWQAALCVISPSTRSQSVIYASRDYYYYVLANDSYKIHYYFISLIMISMVCMLVFGIGKMIRSGDRSESRPLALQGISVALLISLCIFANTTAFFRKAQAIQTPVASILTCLFFVALGASIGVYTGSFLNKKGKLLGTGLPVFLSAAAVIIMYIGEAAMMSGNLYRFGKGWFFNGLPKISLAPVDILVILLSGAATYIVLARARKKDNWPGKPLTIVSLAICIVIAVLGFVFSGSTSAASSASGDDIYGCYEFDECIFMNPLSSFMAMKDNMPYIYCLTEDRLLIADIKNDSIVEYTALYEKTPVAEDAFLKISELGVTPLSSWLPDLSQYKERWLWAVFYQDDQQRYSLYQMDDEIWLVDLKKYNLWSIFRLERTNKYAPSDFE